MNYIIDSNVFITPHRGYSPIDVAVSLWAKLRDLAQCGTINSIDKVEDELNTHDDELSLWMRTNVPNSFFLSTNTQETINKLQSIINWANSSTFYNQTAKRKFLHLDKADIYLVAFAAVDPTNWTVVSMEKPNPHNTGEIKLPDACTYFNVRCISLQDMMRELGEIY